MVPVEPGRLRRRHGDGVHERLTAIDECVSNLIVSARRLRVDPVEVHVRRRARDSPGSANLFRKLEAHRHPQVERVLQREEKRIARLDA